MTFERIKGDACDALFEELAELDKICVGCDSWSAKSFREEAENDCGILLCAMSEGQVTGLICGYFAADQADIVSVGVHPVHRRNGIAEKLINAFENALPDITESIFLEVRESNSPAIGLYEKCGFKKIGVRKRFYHDPEENAVLMQKNFRKRG